MVVDMRQLARVLTHQRRPTISKRSKGAVMRSASARVAGSGARRPLSSIHLRPFALAARNSSGVINRTVTFWPSAVSQPIALPARILTTSSLVRSTTGMSSGMVTPGSVGGSPEGPPGCLAAIFNQWAQRGDDALLVVLVGRGVVAGGD